MEKFATDRIFRISPPDYARTAPKLAPTLQEQIPEIEHCIRLKGAGGMMKHEENQFYEDEIMFVNPEVFEVFSFDFIEGDAEEALLQPNTIVLSEKMADRYFGSEEALGKIIQFSDTIPLTVTGVVRDWPDQSHLINEGWISFSTFENNFNLTMDTWSNNIYYTYALLKEEADVSGFREKLQNFTAGVINVLSNRENYQLAAQNIRDIHLQSNKSMELEVNGSLSQVYIFSSVAFFILLIGGINYVNLATARASRHAREIGVRKTMGARFRQLVMQFLGESVVLSTISLVLALGLVFLSLPYFNNLADKAFVWTDFLRGPVVASLLGFSLLVGLLAGGYPAFVLSSFRPIEVLKGKLKLGNNKDGLLRNGLVVLQFAISLVLLVGTLVVFQQINFMKNQPLGFDKDQVVVVPFFWEGEVMEKFDLIKSEWEQHTNIETVTASGDVPGRMATQMGYWVEGMEKDEWEGIDALYVHKDFIETYGIEMVAGRAFDSDIQSDMETAYVLNESAVQSIGWTPQEAVGQRMDVHVDGRVIGVVEDFHFNSLHERIRPLVMAIRPSWCGYLSFRANTNNIESTLDYVESSWRQMFPNRPFQYNFMDEDFERHYLAEVKTSKVASVFALLAVLIACIGLFGLATYTCTQRQKEIAVRKVLGANIGDIVRLLSGTFVRPVLLAFLVAIPLAYYLLRQWLNGFAYQINISWWWFALCCLLLLIIAGFSVSIQSVKAAMDNPVKALKSE